MAQCAFMSCRLYQFMAKVKVLYKGFMQRRILTSRAYCSPCGKATLPSIGQVVGYIFGGVRVLYYNSSWNSG